ncbi:unnamed protein product [Linum tenue]|uniref:Uncharacterized protein n=1 Tax=Linum tenue TaxID=586396 RepID=A0AAV0HSL8_9ROSI|nr:unnamed protein product [Linum tenue]CAI0453861.1 unnamed protein product [Linum tenue]
MAGVLVLGVGTKP